MPGFLAGLEGLGAGLGQFAQQYRQQQESQRLMAMTLAALKEKQQEREAAASAWPALLSADQQGPTGQPTTAPGSLSPLPPGFGNFGGAAPPMPQAPRPAPSYGASVGGMARGGGGLPVNVAAMDHTPSTFPSAATPPALAGSPQTAEQRAQPGWQDPGNPDPSRLALPSNAPAPRPGPNAPPGGAGDDSLQAQILDAARKAGQITDPQVYGRMSLKGLASQIEKANPGADPTVKMMALERAQKLLAPEERMQMQLYMRENQQAFQLALKDMQIEASERGRRESIDAANARAADAGGTVVQEGGKTYRVKGNTMSPVMIAGTNEQAGPVSRVGSASQASDPKTVDFVAKGIANYDLAPLGGWAMRSKFGQDVMGKVVQLNPEYDQTKYGAKARGNIAFTSGRQGDSVRSFSVAIDHLAVMEDAANALASGDVQGINRVQNLIQKELGYSGPIDFNFVKSIVGAEVSKAVIGGVGALKDREELRQGFDAANSPEQLAGVASMAKRLMAGQLGGYRRQGVSAGFSEQDFEKALSPRARAELESLRGGAPSAAQPGQQTPAALPPGDVELLKGDPSETRKKQFDEVYGPGAAAKALGP